MAVPLHLRSLQALDVALRCGSLKDAAAMLSITPAAVGQRVKALEDYLGIALLVRGRFGLQPAPGLGFALEHLRAGFKELELVADLLDMQRGQEIHVAATPDFADLWLKPRLGRFRELHPNIRFSVNGEGDAPVRIAPVDCEITFGAARGAPTEAVLFRDFVLPISSPENTQRISTVAKRERLEGFPLLHLDFYKDDPTAPGWAAWLKNHPMRRTAPNRGIRFQRIRLALEAVLASAGLTLCGLALLSEVIDNGTLSLPFPMSTGSWTEHAFIARVRPEALSRPHVRRFRDWLERESQETQSWLARRIAGANRKGVARRR